MPAPTYNVVTIDSVTKQMEVTINPGETITLVCSGSNGFFPTSKGWYFGGTPAGSPTAPATPANSISLATIAVAAGALSIGSGDITDTRVLTTTNLPGDISAVTAGTGLSGGGSSGGVTLSIDTAVTADLSTAQTLTNKTLTTPIISSISNTGAITLPTSTDTLVGRATTDTLTNKTLTSPLINLGINTQTGTTYTTVLADNGKLTTLSNASATACARASRLKPIFGSLISETTF